MNVGANIAHELKSPVYSDGRFEFVPIPEEDEDTAMRSGGDHQNAAR